VFCVSEGAQQRAKQQSRAGIIVFVLLQQANGVCCRWTR
jgi:hypothetical protein